MVRIRIDNLVPGQKLPLSLYSPAGQLLLPAGSPVTQAQIDAFVALGGSEVYLAKDTGELVAAGVLKAAPPAALAVGQKVDDTLLTRLGQVLIEAGDTVEQRHVDAAKAGNADGAAEASDDESGDDAAAAAAVHDSTNLRRERVVLGDSLLTALDKDIKTTDLRVKAEQCLLVTKEGAAGWPSTAELATIRSEAVDQIRRLHSRVEAGISISAAAFDPVVNGLMERLRQHPTRFTQLALLCPRREDYLPDHAYTVAVLALATGSCLSWPETKLRELGLAALVADLGMLMLPQRLRSTAGELSDQDRSRMQRHPIHTLAMLEHIEGIAPIVKIAAVQHHERENGTGYPRGTRKDGICDAARVLAVADSFAAATEPRSFRQSKLPYLAMEELLRGATGMFFWKPAVRALVQAAGVFPVGSFVKLNTGVPAHVIACNPRTLDRPIVQPLSNDLRPAGATIDLSGAKDLSIVRPIAGTLAA